MKLTDAAKRSIHTWSAAGLSHRAIAARLQSELGVVVSHVAVGNLLKREVPAPPKASPRRSRSSSPSPSSADASSSAGSPPGSTPPSLDDAEEELRILRKLRKKFFRAAIRPGATALDRRRETETLLEVLRELHLRRPTTPASNEATEQVEALANATIERLRKLR